MYKCTQQTHSENHIQNIMSNNVVNYFACYSKHLVNLVTYVGGGLLTLNFVIGQLVMAQPFGAFVVDDFFVSFMLTNEHS